jgi:hypothetical protein
MMWKEKTAGNSRFGNNGGGTLINSIFDSL